MTEEEKKNSPAYLYLKSRRMRFLSLYPTDEHLLLHLLQGGSERWTDDGNIEDDDRIEEAKCQLTEEGWNSFCNMSQIPSNWYAPHPGSLLLNIPDHAHESWLDEISGLIYRLEQLKTDDVVALIAINVRSHNYSKLYEDAYIRDRTKAYHDTVQIFKDKRIAERIAAIRHKRQHANSPAPQPKVEPGAMVRFHTGVDEAIVERISTIPGKQYGYGSDSPIALLDRMIEGSSFHFVENLVATQFPPTPPEDAK